MSDQVQKWRQRWLFEEYAPKVFTKPDGTDIEVYEVPDPWGRRYTISEWVMEGDEVVETLMGAYQPGEYEVPTGFVYAPYIPILLDRCTLLDHERRDPQAEFDFDDPTDPFRCFVEKWPDLAFVEEMNRAIIRQIGIPKEILDNE